MMKGAGPYHLVLLINNSRTVIMPEAIWYKLHNEL